MKSLCRIFSFCLLLILLPAQLSAHAFLEHSDPPVGGKVHSSPAAVRIWFTEVIESASSSIQVFDATGKQVDKKDMHLPSPIDRLIPLVEFAMETPLNRGAGGPTTGTINPGVIWAGKYLQVGVEAVIPINEHTGNNVGVIAQLHFFLDDLFPHTIGRPLFGGNK